MSSIDTTQALGEVWSAPSEKNVHVTQAQAEVWSAIADPAEYVSQVLAEVWHRRLPLPLRTFPVGGFDLYFTLPATSSGNTLSVITDIIVDPVLNVTAKFVITNEGGSYYSLALWAAQQNVMLEKVLLSTTFDTDVPQAFRVLFHNEHCSWYIGGVSIYTFSNTNVIYPANAPQISFVGSVGMTLTNVKLSENHDWRPDIWLDTQGDGMSAVKNVIQERPIDLYVRDDGILYVFYGLHPDPYAISTKIKSITRNTSYGKNTASDFVVYYADVQAFSDLDSLEQDGFSTVVVRLGSLDVGALEAAVIMSKKARESRLSVTCTCRPDLRIQMGDTITISWNASGIGTAMEISMHVDSINLSIKHGKANMVLEGRSYEA